MAEIRPPNVLLISAGVFALGFLAHTTVTAINFANPHAFGSSPASLRPVPSSSPSASPRISPTPAGIASPSLHGNAATPAGPRETKPAPRGPGKYEPEIAPVEALRAKTA